MKLMKLMKRLSLCIVALGFATTAFAQTGLDDPNSAPYYEALKGKRVVFVPVGMGTDLTFGWQKGLAEELGAHGIEFETRDPNWDTTVGAQIMTALVSERPDAIVVQNPDVTSYARIIKRAEEAGIYVFQANMRSNYSSTAYVGVDNLQIGAMNVQGVSKFCEGKSGKIAIIEGTETSTGSLYQLRGVHNELPNHPHLKIVASQAANWDATQARQIMSTVLQQHPDLCGVIGFWDGMDIGAAAAISEAGLQDAIYLTTGGGGEQTNNCDKVADGTFDQNSSYSVPGQARDLSTMIKWALQSGIAPVDTPRVSIFSKITAVTAENANDASSCWSMQD